MNTIAHKKILRRARIAPNAEPDSPPMERVAAWVIAGIALCLIVARLWGIDL